MHPGKQFLPLDNSTLLPCERFAPLLLQVRIRNGYGSECGYPQTYVRVKSYSSQSVAGAATLRVPRDPVQLKGRVPVSCQILVPRVATRGSSNAPTHFVGTQPLSLRALHSGSWATGLDFVTRSDKRGLMER